MTATPATVPADPTFDPGTRAAVVGDSVSPAGDRVTTLSLQYPRYIHAELMTHRVFCLAGDTELYFDAPSAVVDGKRRVHKMTVEEFHRKWHEGTEHQRLQRGDWDVSDVDADATYSTTELAETVGAPGHQVIVQSIRDSGLPHSRDGREYRIDGAEFLDWFHTPSTLSYSLKTRLEQMHLRCLDEDAQEFTWTHVNDVWESGEKDTFRLTLDNGKTIVTSKDHLFYTEDGWQTLEEATGLTMTDNGVIAWDEETPRFATNGVAALESAEWFQEKVDEGHTSDDIAELLDVSVNVVKNRRVKHGVRPNLSAARKRSGFVPWNKGKTYRSPKASEATKRAIAEGRMKVRRGEDSNFWKGGITEERKLIGAWTQKVAPEVHEKYDHTCVLCPSGQDRHAHHADPVAKNPDRAYDITNLVSLCDQCHREVHSRHLEDEFLEAFENDMLDGFWDRHGTTRNDDPEWKSSKRVGNRLVPRWAGVERIEYVGVQQTYDIEVQGPWHNFVADGIVVHNSRNAGSSRAVPVMKMVNRVIDHPVVPDEFGENQRGMQAGETVDEDIAAAARAVWLKVAEAAIEGAATLAELGIHKQHANRLLEPFGYIQVVVTATDWAGFFAQRISPLAQPEIHELARLMKGQMDASTPQPVAAGQWHTPFIRPDDGEDDAYWQQAAAGRDLTAAEARKRVAVARCARVSYLTHEGVKDLDADLGLYDRLVSADPPHASPLEHVCTPDRSGQPSRGNLTGWEQLRHRVLPAW